uniref:CSON010745 protein n=1 Tax=Culicoides sonorensis TaxID=179676 RepID=A0A336M5Y6_CULSO
MAPIANKTNDNLRNNLHKTRSSGKAQVTYRESNCPICLIQFKTSIVTNCGHQFCNLCLKKCMKRSKDCPVCRNRLVKNLFMEFSEYFHGNGNERNARRATKNSKPNEK